MATISQIQTKSEFNATLTMEGAAVSGETLESDALNPGTRTYTSTSTPAGTQHYAARITLPAPVGSGSDAEQEIDLTNWTDIEGVARDSTDLQVHEVRVIAGSSNTAVVTFGGGDSNPYELFGSTKTIDINPAQVVHLRWTDGSGSGAINTPAVSSSVKTLKLSGAEDDTATVEIILG